MRTLATSICLSFNNQLHGESCAVWKRSCAVWSCAVWERCSCLIRSHKLDLIKQLHGGCLHYSCHLVSPSIFFHRATRAAVLWSFSLKMMNLDRNVCFVLLSARCLLHRSTENFSWLGWSKSIFLLLVKTSLTSSLNKSPSGSLSVQAEVS